MRCGRVGLFVLAALMTTAFGCNGDDPPTTSEMLLPENPQASPEPAPGVLSFALTEPGLADTAHVSVSNGGQADLVISAPTVTPDDGAFTLGEVYPASGTVASKQALSIPVEFKPSARGVHIAELVIESNAENHPSLTYQLVGPGSQSPLPNVPDIVAFETEADVIPTLGTAFVRFFNVGGATLSVSKYAIINNIDDAFRIAVDNRQPSDDCLGDGLCSGSDNPASCSPILVGGGSFVILTVLYEPPGSGTHTATFQVVSDDPDECVLTINLRGTTP